MTTQDPSGQAQLSRLSCETVGPGRMAPIHHAVLDRGVPIRSERKAMIAAAPTNAISVAAVADHPAAVKTRPAAHPSTLEPR